MSDDVNSNSNGHNIITTSDGCTFDLNNLPAKLPNITDKRIQIWPPQLVEAVQVERKRRTDEKKAQNLRTGKKRGPKSISREKSPPAKRRRISYSSKTQRRTSNQSDDEDVFMAEKALTDGTLNVIQDASANNGSNADLQISAIAIVDEEDGMQSASEMPAIQMDDDEQYDGESTFSESETVNVGGYQLNFSNLAAAPLLPPLTDDITILLQPHEIVAIEAEQRRRNLLQSQNQPFVDGLTPEEPAEDIFCDVGKGAHDASEDVIVDHAENGAPTTPAISSNIVKVNGVLIDFGNLQTLTKLPILKGHILNSITNSHKTMLEAERKRRNQRKRNERKEAINAQKRDYRARHSEDINARRRERDSERREQINAQERQRHAENADGINEQRRQRHAENADGINEQRRQRHAENADGINEQRRERYRENANEINEQRRESYAENANHINEQRRERYVEIADEINETRRQSYAENSNEINEQRRERYAENADEINETRRQSYADNVDNANEQRRSAARNFRNRPTNAKCHNLHGPDGCASMDVAHQVNQYKVGTFNSRIRCIHCKALLLAYEYRDRPRPCCAKGKVDLDAKFKILQSPPNLMKILTDHSFPQGRDYLRNPRAYNRIVSFGTIKVGTEPSPPHGPYACRINGQIGIMLSDLWCKQGQTSSHGQLYSLTPTEAESVRRETVSNMAQPLNADVVVACDNMIRQNHALAAVYKSGAEKFQEAHDQAVRNGTRVPICNITLLTNREAHAVNIDDPSIHSHRTETPTAEQVALMWKSDNGNPPQTKGVVLNGRPGRLPTMHALNPNVDPAIYPLLYPYGTQGYRLGMPLATYAGRPEDDPDIIEDNDEAAAESDNITMNDDRNQLLFEDGEEQHGEESFDLNEYNQEDDERMHENLAPQGPIDEALLPDEDDDLIIIENENFDDDGNVEAQIEREITRVLRDAEAAEYAYANSQSSFLQQAPYMNEMMEEVLNNAQVSMNNERTEDLPQAVNDENIDEDVDDTGLEDQVVYEEDCGEPFVLRGNPNQQLLQDDPVIELPKSRKFVSMRQNYLYLFQMRDEDADVKNFHWLWSQGQLAQEYTIVSLNRVEANEMEWQKKVQSRVTHPQALRDALSRGLNPGENLGKVFMLPKTVKGGRADMQYGYANAMTINRKLGPYTWFLTFTGNPNWEEIQNSLGPGQTYVDRPDICMRVFMGYFKELKNDLFKKQILGKVKHWVYSVEWQKRSMLHAHILISCEEPPDGFTAEYVNKYCCAEIPKLPDESAPNYEQIKRLRQIVTSCMIHTCHDGCKIPGQTLCSKKFPCLYCQFTVLQENKPTIYKRRAPAPDVIPDGVNPEREFGETFMKTLRNGTQIQITNKDVVPYNPYILLKYNCHANLEFVGSQKCVEYVLKYLLKGNDMAYVRFNGVNNVDYDEFEQHARLRYMTAMEAIYRMYGHEIYDMSHQVLVKSIHLPKKNPVIISEDTEANDINEATLSRMERTMLTEFFVLCLNDPNARQYKYDEIGYHYWFNKNTKKWLPRKKKIEKLLIRINSVTPTNTELVSLRLLLLATPGPTSFEFLRTVNGDTYETFTEAARVRGLLENLDMWKECLEEAANENMGVKQFRRFFTMLIYHCRPSSPQELFDHFEERLASHNPNKTPAELREWLLQRLQYHFYHLNTSCEEMGLPSPANFNMDQAQQDEEDDLDTLDPATRLTADAYANRLYDGLNTTQQGFQDTVIAASEGLGEQKLFYVTGSGGTGKTTLFRSIMAKIKANGQRYVSTASTGIAALLLPGGRTVHSTFRINNDINSESTPNIARGTMFAENLRNADVIFIDEISMLHKDVFIYVNKTLQSLYPASDIRSRTNFGGKVIVLSGDFRQLPPVVENGAPADTIQASIKTQEVFRLFQILELTENQRVDPNEVEFVQWLDRVGNPYIVPNTPISLNSLHRLELEPEQMVQNPEQLIDFCFPDEVLRSPLDHSKELLESAILCPTNRDAFEMNETILNMLPGEAQTFTSIDHHVRTEMCEIDNDVHVHAADIDIENIHQMTPTGLPPHELKLKVGAKVMLIRNLSLRDGLSNGTILQVERMSENLLTCRKIKENGDVGELIRLPKVKFEHGKKAGYRKVRFTRIQFPVRLAFVMTINKSQGQTLHKVGLDLQQQVFAHGQLYVAMSRVRQKNGVRVYSNAEEPNTVMNCVYHELLI